MSSVNPVILGLPILNKLDAKLFAVAQKMGLSVLVGHDNQQAVPNITSNLVTVTHSTPAASTLET